MTSWTMANPKRMRKIPSEAGSLGAKKSEDALFHDRKSAHEKPQAARTRCSSEASAEVPSFFASRFSFDFSPSAATEEKEKGQEV